MVLIAALVAGAFSTWTFSPSLRGLALTEMVLLRRAIFALCDGWSRSNWLCVVGKPDIFVALKALHHIGFDHLLARFTTVAIALSVRTAPFHPLGALAGFTSAQHLHVDNCRRLGHDGQAHHRLLGAVTTRRRGSAVGIGSWSALGAHCRSLGGIRSRWAV